MRNKWDQGLGKIGLMYDMQVFEIIEIEQLKILYILFFPSKLVNQYSLDLDLKLFSPT